MNALQRNLRLGLFVGLMAIACVLAHYDRLAEGACLFIAALLILSPLLPSAHRRIEMDGLGVRRLSGGKVVESVLWSELVKVSVATSDEGPYVEDVYFLLHASAGHGVAVPHGKAVEIALLERLQRLPRFDNLELIRAMGCSDNALFLCWEGSAGEGVACEAVVA